MSQFFRFNHMVRGLFTAILLSVAFVTLLYALRAAATPSGQITGRLLSGVQEIRTAEEELRYTVQIESELGEQLLIYLQTHGRIRQQLEETRVGSTVTLIYQDGEAGTLITPQGRRISESSPYLPLLAGLAFVCAAIPAILWLSPQIVERTGRR